MNRYHDSGLVRSGRLETLQTVVGVVDGQIVRLLPSAAICNLEKTHKAYWVEWLDTVREKTMTLTFGFSVLDNVGDERIVSVGAGRSRPREGHSTAGRLLPPIGAFESVCRWVNWLFLIIPGFEGVAAVRAVLKIEREIQTV